MNKMVEMDPRYPTPPRKFQSSSVKRQRISNACNQCRKRKVRCDEAQPRCRNCSERNEECITTDPRTQENVLVRRRTSKTPTSALSGMSSIFIDGVSTSPAQTVRSFDSPRDETWQSSADTSWSQLHGQSHSSSTGSTPSYGGMYSDVSPAPQSHLSHDAHRGHGARRGGSMALELVSRPTNAHATDQRHYSYNLEMIINKTTQDKRKFIGGGTLQSLSKYLDHYFEYRGMERIGPRFVYGMQHAEEFPLPQLGDSQNLPSIPSLPERNLYLKTFFERIHPMFPILDPASFLSDLEKIETHDINNLHQDQVPILAATYCVFALGADEIAGSYTSAGLIYLTGAFKLWTYLISVPYLASVQALLLLTVALKARNKDGCGGQSLAQAIRIAQSLGINHSSVIEATTIHGEQLSVEDDTDLATRCWWVCFCLEQNFGLEIGRPIFIREINCHQALPRSSPVHDSDFFGQWVKLCRIQSRLYEALYARPPELRNAGDLLRDIGDIDRELCHWAAAVEPEEIRPTLDLLCPLKDLHFATFLAVSYFQTLIIVHQASLLVEPGTYKSKVEHLYLDNASRARLRSSEFILINSARRIADLILRQVDEKASSMILGPTGPMIALMILGCHIMKDVGERRNKADLELMTALSKFVEGQYSQSGQHPKFVEAITILQHQIHEEIIRRDVDPSPNSVNLSSEHVYRKQTLEIEMTRLGTYQGQWAPATPGGFGDWNNVFGGFVLDDPWNFLQEDGPAMDVSDDTMLS